MRGLRVQATYEGWTVVVANNRIALGGCGSAFFASFKAASQFRRDLQPHIPSRLMVRRATQTTSAFIPAHGGSK